MTLKPKSPCDFLGLSGTLAIVARLKAGGDEIGGESDGSTETPAASVLEVPAVVPQEAVAASTAPPVDPPAEPAKIEPAPSPERLDPVSPPRRRRR